MEQKIFELLRQNKIGHAKAHYLKHELLLLFSVSGALPLLDNILKEEMSAEMRTWLMELRLLIGNDR
jgi:hypothetical protein